jgi:hypothetical protein
VLILAALPDCVAFVTTLRFADAIELNGMIVIHLRYSYKDATSCAPYLCTIEDPLNQHTSIFHLYFMFIMKP